MDVFGQGSSTPPQSPQPSGSWGSVPSQPQGGGKFQLEQEPPKKPLPWKKILIGAGVGLTLLSAGIGGTIVYRNVQEQKAQEAAIRSQVTNLANSIASDVSGYKLAHLVDGESVWDLNVNYASRPIMNRFLEKVGSHVSVSEDGGQLTVTHPNWDYITMVLKDYRAWDVEDAVKELKPEDHDYIDAVSDAFMLWFIDNADDILLQRNGFVQTALVDGDVKPFSKTTFNQGEWYKSGKVSSDFTRALDEAVFSNTAFHTLLDTYSGIASGAYGKFEATEDYTAWNDRRVALSDAITSMRELYNEELIPLPDWRGFANPEDAVSEQEYPDASADVTNPFYVSELQPVLVALDAYRELTKLQPLPYTYEDAGASPDKVIPHSLFGVSFIQSPNSDAVSSSVQRGDGSYDAPYTVGTPFITKMLDVNGKYVDVKVTLHEVVTGQEAIEDALAADERNQGFTMESDYKLATIHFSVENLEDREVTVNSEWSLADKDLNLIPRTGSMFSFAERVTIPARGIEGMSDWINARETMNQPLIWGKSFNRKFPAVFVNALGNQVFDELGNDLERVTRVERENTAQQNQDALTETAEEQKASSSRAASESATQPQLTEEDAKREKEQKNKNN